jgi:transcriptional regulator GlxA family with amidase domain
MDSKMLSLNADYAIREIDAVDILVLPGGTATLAQLHNEEVIAWVRQIHNRSKWTTSVCTGSLILAAAGLLKDLEATTHWAAIDALTMFRAKPTHQRVVRQGKIITAAGVSAGIDMALSLVALECGEEQV